MKNNKAKKNKNNRYKYKLIKLITFLLFIIILFLTSRYIYIRKAPNVIISKNQYIRIYPNETIDHLLDTLKNKKIFRSYKSFRYLALHHNLDDKLTAGCYLLKKNMNNQYLIRMFYNGWQTPINVIFSGYCRDLGQISKKLSNSFMADSAAFASALSDTLLSNSLGFDRANYIGMFIPNTYQFYWTTSPKSVILRFNKEYKRFWNTKRTNQAIALNLSQKEVITLASIVMGESNYVPEQPIIASVYINRLRRHMKLQADPTIWHSIIQKDPSITRILNEHLDIDSPYNTYKYHGLPPGPINTPSIAAIDAVLSGYTSNYLFFCARPTFDGQHNFASSYSEHLKNARLYHKALDERLNNE